MNSIGVIGLGVVGGAIYRVLSEKQIPVIGYDKYKDQYANTFNSVLNTDIVMLCLPTLFSNQIQEYDKSAIYEVCEQLSINNYAGLVVIKSTVEPNTTENLSLKHRNLDFVHNPEFISARTAYEDTLNQTHMVLGKTGRCNENKYLAFKNWCEKMYPETRLSECSSTESESMKICVNSFYAVKIQFFNEIYMVCQNTGADYDRVKDMMLLNGWISPMHTQVPGTDGKLSYGGVCLPKDVNALLQFMIRQNIPHAVLEGTAKENAEMRFH